MVDAEIEFQNNVTERWKADMGSDVARAKAYTSSHLDLPHDYVYVYDGSRQHG